MNESYSILSAPNSEEIQFNWDNHTIISNNKINDALYTIAFRLCDEKGEKKINDKYHALLSTTWYGRPKISIDDLVAAAQSSDSTFKVACSSYPHSYAADHYMYFLLFLISLTKTDNKTLERNSHLLKHSKNITFLYDWTSSLEYEGVPVGNIEDAYMQSLRFFMEKTNRLKFNVPPETIVDKLTIKKDSCVYKCVPIINRKQIIDYHFTQTARCINTYWDLPKYFIHKSYGEQIYSFAFELHREDKEPLLVGVVTTDIFLKILHKWETSEYQEVSRNIGARIGGQRQTNKLLKALK